MVSWYISYATCIRTAWSFVIHSRSLSFAPSWVYWFLMGNVVNSSFEFNDLSKGSWAIISSEVWCSTSHLSSFWIVSLVVSVYALYPVYVTSCSTSVTCWVWGPQYLGLFLTVLLLIVIVTLDRFLLVVLIIQVVERLTTHTAFLYRPIDKFMFMYTSNLSCIYISLSDSSYALTFIIH